MDYTYIKNKLQDRGICIIIPTYNNANTIVDIINECKLYCKDIIVVNDGCSDDTTHLVDKLGGITIVENKINKGKGYALKIRFFIRFFDKMPSNFKSSF